MSCLNVEVGGRNEMKIETKSNFKHLVFEQKNLSALIRIYTLSCFSQE